MSDDYGKMPDWVRGDGLKILAEFTDPVTKEPSKLGGATIVFTVKENINDSDLQAKIQKELVIIDPLLGTALLDLSKDDTDIDPFNYYFDFQITDASGVPFTPSLGRWKIVADVTRTS